MDRVYGLVTNGGKGSLAVTAQFPSCGSKLSGGNHSDPVLFCIQLQAGHVRSVFLLTTCHRCRTLLVTVLRPLGEGKCEAGDENSGLQFGSEVREVAHRSMGAGTRGGLHRRKQEIAPLLLVYGHASLHS